MSENGEKLRAKGILLISRRYSKRPREQHYRSDKVLGVNHRTLEIQGNIQSRSDVRRNGRGAGSLIDPFLGRHQALDYLVG